MTGFFLLSNSFPSYLFCMFFHKGFTTTKNIVDEIRFMYPEHLKYLIMKECNKFCYHMSESVVQAICGKDFQEGRV